MPSDRQLIAKILVMWALCVALALIACGDSGPAADAPDRAPLSRTAARTPTNARSCHVGGCAGQVCSSAAGVITSCDWQPHYDCLSDSTCGNFDAEGGCAWKRTPELVACLARHGK